jgi:hypothetical protein
LFAGKCAEYRIGWCELLLPGCAVDERYTGQRVKRPRCGAPSLYSLLVPAGNKRPALPSNRDSGVEPSGAWAMATREKTSPSMKGRVVWVVLPRSTWCWTLPSTRSPEGFSVKHPVTCVNQAVTFRPGSVKQPGTCVKQPVTSRPFSAPKRPPERRETDRNC